MIGLSIESSCDETACAILKDGREVMSNIISTQIDIHKQFGGVVPEIASRHHVQNISMVVEEALTEAKITFKDLDFICVTYGPGLIGALLVGVAYAKSLAYGLGIPLVPVHHIEGHIAANYITYPELKPPYMALVVSGGHSHIVYVEDYCKFEILAKTRDDAVGEAFDKVARVLGFTYPGGPLVSKKAEEGKPTYKLPTTKFDNLDFSFSGVKTAVLNIAHKEKENLRVADMCASFEENVTDVLIHNAMEAMKQKNVDKIVIAGGVSANRVLRKKFVETATNNGYKAYIPDLKYCTDNAAMIGSAGYYNFVEGYFAKEDLNAVANLKLGEHKF
ncbi:MAG: tRNA (adenosine(37)-N6)-threonylcarbamoyltransferase complex transferase subunit TsaD [Clostridia bacterium]